MVFCSNNTYDHNVIITWNTEAISSGHGSLSELTNSDQMYKINVL